MSAPGQTPASSGLFELLAAQRRRRIAFANLDLHAAAEADEDVRRLQAVVSTATATTPQRTR